MTGATVRPIRTEPGFKFCSYILHDGERKLPVSAFNKKVSAHDGLQSRCRLCQNALEADRVRAEYSLDDVRLTPEQQRVSREARKVKPTVEPPQDAEEAEDDDQEVDPNAWGRARYWRWLVFRRYARHASKVLRADHAVDELEIERWTNEVLAEFRAGHPLDVAMGIANEDLAEDFGEEDLPGGMQPAPQKPKPRLVLVEMPVIEEMDRPVQKREHPLYSRVQERFHPPELRIAKAQDDGDPTSTEGLALEAGRVTETDVAAFAPSTHHKGVEARLGRKAGALAPRKPQTRATLPQAYCGLCKRWGFHTRVQCPRYVARGVPSPDVVALAKSATECWYCLDGDPVAIVRGKPACAKCETSVAESSARPELVRAETVRIQDVLRDVSRENGRRGAEKRWAKRRLNGTHSVEPTSPDPEKTSVEATQPQNAAQNIPKIIPALDLALPEEPLEERVFAELSRRDCAQVYDLQDAVDAGADEVREALGKLERAGRARKTGGRVALWQAVRS